MLTASDRQQRAGAAAFDFALEGQLLLKHANRLVVPAGRLQRPRQIESRFYPAGGFRRCGCPQFATRGKDLVVSARAEKHVGLPTQEVRTRSTVVGRGGDLLVV